jgi:D-sedoheptulose 7-phosphate isomerase
MIEIRCSRSYFANLSGVLGKLPLREIDEVASALLNAYHTRRMIYLFGNGGSAALASHFACDLGKGTVGVNGNRFRVIALTDSVPLMTAWANDSRYDDIFAEQLANFVQPCDVALAISGSGNSPNVLRALHVARDAGATTVGLTGFEGGQMRNLCDICVVVPSDNMQIIEDIHLSVTHAVFSSIRRQMLHTAAATA